MVGLVDKMVFKGLFQHKPVCDSILKTEYFPLSFIFAITWINSTVLGEILFYIAGTAQFE